MNVEQLILAVDCGEMTPEQAAESFRRALVDRLAKIDNDPEMAWMAEIVRNRENEDRN